MSVEMDADIALASSLQKVVSIQQNARDFFITCGAGMPSTKDLRAFIALGMPFAITEPCHEDPKSNTQTNKNVRLNILKRATKSGAHPSALPRSGPGKR